MLARYVFWPVFRWFPCLSCLASGCLSCFTRCTVFTSGIAARSNVGDYPWTGNWMYTAQRWTGGIAFAYIVWHTYTMRFTGVDLHQYPGRVIRQGAGRGVSHRLVPVLCGGADLRVVAFRVWHLAVLRQVGDCLGRESAQTVLDRVRGLLLRAERGRVGQLDIVALASAAAD